MSLDLLPDSELILNFRRNMKFGNEQHIRIVDKLGDLGRAEALLKSKEHESRGIEAAKAKVETLRSQIVNMIKFANKTSK